MTSAAIVQKLWNYCNVLRDDGMSYGDYVEQLTYLLFLKMADERTKPPYNQPSAVPAKYNWPTLLKKDGDDLFDHYRHMLESLGNEKGLLGLIFNKSQNKFQDPSKLRRLVVDLIDKENWSVMSADVKGDAYEGLLEKNAQDTKSGAGQYFTPRPLIQAMVDVIQPKPKETLCDPACGTGGFLLAAHDYVVKHNPNMSADEKRKLKGSTFKGWELVQSTARLCAMNLMLHSIGTDKDIPIIGVGLSCCRPRRPVRYRSDQSSLRQEEQHHHRCRERQGIHGRPISSSARTSGPRRPTNSSISSSM